VTALRVHFLISHLLNFSFPLISGSVTTSVSLYSNSYF